MPINIRDDDDTNLSEASGSEDDYNEREKELLKKVRNKKKEYSDSEDEVFNVGPNEDEDYEEDDDVDDDDDDDDRSDLAMSDIEGQDSDDGLPDVRAWGNEKKKYYSTDYIDPDYGGFQGKDAYLAELEEAEAKNLHKQLAQELDDDNFELEFFTKKKQEEDVQEEKTIKTDSSKLSKRQKLEILQKESPEFFGLVEDFQAKMSLARDYLSPMLKMHKAKKIPNCEPVNFIQTQYELILNYCVNIYMYLLLKASEVDVKKHPIRKRLYQYQQLLTQLEPVFEEIIKPQIEIMLREMNAGEEALKVKTEKKKMLKLLAGLTKQKEQKKKKRVKFENEEQVSKKIKIADDSNEETMEIDVDSNESSSEDEEQKEEKETDQQNDDGDVEKRAITYQMSKNKGLTPHRKKEQRNPRVKHKLKYKKALSRRKGAVREPRKELSRYGGEISGIKATVSKSVKIKT